METHESRGYLSLVTSAPTRVNGLFKQPLRLPVANNWLVTPALVLKFLE